MPAVTISTSIAGRGTDIRLGGDPQGIMRTAISCLLLPFMVQGTFLFHFHKSACPLTAIPRISSRKVVTTNVYVCAHMTGSQILLHGVDSLETLISCCTYEIVTICACDEPISNHAWNTGAWLI